MSIWSVTTNENKKENQNKENEEKPPKIGNMALRVSQEPTPLIGFGDKVIDKDQVQLYLFDWYQSGKNIYSNEFSFSLVYGIADNFSITLSVPTATVLKDKPFHSSGLEDIFIEGEYAYYNKDTKIGSSQATIVGGVSFPTGSTHITPSTGFGSPSFFLGLTYNYIDPVWFYFTGYGVNFSTTTKNRTKYGNQFFYQYGAGRNISNFNGWIFAWMVEFDGEHNEKDRVNGVLDHNTGGNVIYITPSLWLSSQHTIMQLGIGYAVHQNLYGSQNKNRYQIAFNFAWTL